jgi:hypothetical protein
MEHFDRYVQAVKQRMAAIVCDLPSNTVLCRALSGQRKLQFGISSSPLLNQPGESNARTVIKVDTDRQLNLVRLLELPP